MVSSWSIETNVRVQTVRAVVALNREGDAVVREGKLGR